MAVVYARRLSCTKGDEIGCGLTIAVGVAVGHVVVSERERNDCQNTSDDVFYRLRAAVA